VGSRLGIVLGRYAPGVMAKMLRVNAAAFERDPNAYLDATIRQLSTPDRALFDDPLVREAEIRDLREAYRQGTAGHLQDAVLAMTGTEWGFDLKLIQVPVHLWHGEMDNLVTLNMARYLEGEIPQSRLRLAPGRGHLLTEYAEIIDEVSTVLAAG
jgi:pimeloyl-ACP methyl ester carboxylesterase